MTDMTDTEIWNIWDDHYTYTPIYERPSCELPLIRAILAAYQAKLLAEVEMPEYKYIDRHDVPKEGMCVYTQDQLQAYAAACAAQAREKVLGELERIVYEPPISGNTIAQARVLNDWAAFDTWEQAAEWVGKQFKERP